MAIGIDLALLEVLTIKRIVAKPSPSPCACVLTTQSVCLLVAVANIVPTYVASTCTNQINSINLRAIVNNYATTLRFISILAT